MNANHRLVAAVALLAASCFAGEEPATEPRSTGPAAESMAIELEPGPDTSTWAEGGTISPGSADIRDIQILEVRANGTGPTCGTGKQATLAYKAMQADGNVLDPGTRPFTFRVGAGEAIRGWDVVVAQMRVGDDFTILLPQELAYGPSRGDLKFDMKLLSFE